MLPHLSELVVNLQNECTNSMRVGFDSSCFVKTENGAYHFSEYTYVIL